MRTPASSDEKQCLYSSTSVFFSHSQGVYALLHAWHCVRSVTNIGYTTRHLKERRKPTFTYHKRNCYKHYIINNIASQLVPRGKVSYRMHLPQKGPANDIPCESRRKILINTNSTVNRPSIWTLLIFRIIPTMSKQESNWLNRHLKFVIPDSVIWFIFLDTYINTGNGNRTLSR